MHVFVFSVCTISDPLLHTPAAFASVFFSEAGAANKDEEAKTKTTIKGAMRSLVSHKENKPLVRLNVYFLDRLKREPIPGRR